MKTNPSEFLCTFPTCHTGSCFTSFASKCCPSAESTSCSAFITDKVWPCNALHLTEFNYIKTLTGINMICKLSVIVFVSSRLIRYVAFVWNINMHDISPYMHSMARNNPTMEKLRATLHHHPQQTNDSSQAMSPCCGTNIMHNTLHISFLWDTTSYIMGLKCLSGANNYHA